MWSIIDGKEKVEKLYNGILPDLESIIDHINIFIIHLS